MIRNGGEVLFSNREAYTPMKGPAGALFVGIPSEFFLSVYPHLLFCALRSSRNMLGLSLNMSEENKGWCALKGSTDATLDGVGEDSL